MKRIGFQRLKIDATQFDAIYELEELGSMLANVLPNWEEKIRTDAEKRKTNEIAKKMLEIGMAIDQIIKTTGLSQQDILSLKMQTLKTS